MRRSALSLRARLILLLVLVNAVVLGALAWSAMGDENQLAGQRARRQVELQQRVRELLQGFRPEKIDDLASILSWPLWKEFQDALLIDQRVVRLDGELRPVGAYLNPAGCRFRPADFPLTEITRAVSRAASSNQAIPVARGLALPLVGEENGRRVIWGGVYLRPREQPSDAPFSTRLILAALLTTALGGGALYFLLGRGVLRPIERLAAAAHAFGQGEQPELPQGGQAPELAELIGAFEDMMARIRNFHEELEDEVQRATDRAVQAERRAARQERLAAMGTLAAGLAHEINSPLAGALQGLEILRAEVSRPRGERYGELVQEALQRIASLVQRLLRLAPARMEAGSCALQDVLRDLPDFLASRFERHELTLDLPETPLRVRGSPGDLFPVFLNLFRNALDALDSLPEGRRGRLSVCARPRPEGGAELWIRDDGPGAPEDLLPHVFEPFVTDKEVGAGTGLGLALAHATIRQLGGSLSARNREGGGFEVHLLLAPPEGP